jgi:hypothetical protein
VVSVKILGLVAALAGARVTVTPAPGLEAQVASFQREAERDLAQIESDLDADLPRVDQVEVRLVKHADEIADAAPPNRGAPSWAIGTAYPQEGVVVVALRGRDGTVLDAKRTLAHELAHMVIERALGPGHTPRWLSEGFAYLHSSDSSIARATTLFGAVFGGKLIPLGELDDSFPEGESEAGLAYAESFDFVGFLAERGRYEDGDDRGDRESFRLFLRDLAQGKGLETASEDAYERRLVDLESEWMGGLKSRYLWVPLSLLGGLAWVLGSLLLVIAWWRRRRQNRRRMHALEVEDAVEDAHDQVLH